MIDEIRVQDVALIRDLSIVPADGLTVLTGETGTGKTALLAAIKLLIGERGDASYVREGAPCLVVEGRFFDGNDPDGHVVRRRITADGRGRVEVDGRMASVRELASLVGPSVDLCGQHEHQRLLDVSTHADILDALAGVKARQAREDYVRALGAAREARGELERVREAARTADERLEQAEFVLRRIGEVNPAEGEYEELEATLPKAEHAEALIRAAEGAREALAGDGGALDAMGAAVGELRHASAHDPELAKLASQVEGAVFEVEDVASALRDYRDSVDFDPERLEEMQARFAALRGLLRKYGPQMADVFAARASAEEVVALSRDGDARVKQAKAALDQAEAELAAAADALDAARGEHAPRLAHAISSQMALLEMGTAQVEVESERLPRDRWTAQGPSHVELMYRPAEGLAARPLRKISSGGEISRVMLATKVVQGETDPAGTLVFDEVDAGVGGATAISLAQVLATLAKTHQVIVVTHLAQVAVMAEKHYVVSKSLAESDAPGGPAVPQTLIEEVTGDDRVREVARLLSGDATEASLAHARDMLANAR